VSGTSKDERSESFGSRDGRGFPAVITLFGAIHPERRKPTGLTVGTGNSGIMDPGAATTKVEWRAWGGSAFEEARADAKPLLLALVTPWSAECRKMDETTYAEPRIAANVNDSFVPVRVDADRRPDVRERYHMGGFPSTVFLAPDGSVLTGATFLGVEGFREILAGVRRTWDTRGSGAGSIPRPIRDSAPPGGELSADIEAHMIEQLLAAFDDEFGGWGSDVKFPMPATVEFALVRAREQALRTLEAIRTHLLDTYDGGFYRYARERNWRNACREKLVDENAALVRAFAHAYRYTGEESDRDAAERTVAYLTTDCWTGEAFAASQGGDEDYYRLEATEREAAAAPAVDDTVFADRNGLAVDALLRLAAYTDDERAIRYARRARDHVLETLVDDGAVTHYRADGESGPTGLLVDQARVLRGLATSWSVLGEPGPAVAVADRTIETLRTTVDGAVAFRDAPAADGPGLRSRPLYPLDTTVELAGALLDLSLLADETRYLAVARDALAAFADAADRMGVEVAGYATATARVRAPTAVRVGTAAGSDLHRAALRLADHEAVVVPEAPDAGEAAELVVDGTVEGRAATPAALESDLTDADG
jgi:uncharacterized protein YyaL (SSP411 family)